MLTAQQRDYLLPIAYNAALRAGRAILEIYGNGDYAVAIKSDSSPITEADRRAHAVIREHLGQSRVPQLSEEGREMLYEERSAWDLFWMIDPLDGTREFIKGNGEFTVNIALMSENKPELSVVYVPYIGKMYFCDRLRGSFMKEGVEADAGASFSLEEILGGAKRLPLAGKANSPVRIAISRSHNNEETFRYIDVIRSKYPDAEIVEQGSSYKFGLLAEGAVDCYVRTSNTSEWDTAAGEIVLELAGGRTLTLPDMESMEYNQLTLVNPHFICFSKYFEWE